MLFFNERNALPNFVDETGRRRLAFVKILGHLAENRLPGVAMSTSMTRRRSERSLGNALVPARTALESEIVSAFKEAFEIDEISAEDDFFALGGDSLTAESLALNILNRSGRDFKVARLLFESTPRAIATRLEESAPKPAAYNRPPLFLVHGQDGIILPTKEFLGGLAPDQPLEIFELPGIRNEGEVLTSIEQIAARYLARLSAAYPEGPILLGGACMGCLIALEMAAQLADASRPVHELLLIDPLAPLDVRCYVERSAGIESPRRSPLKRWARRLVLFLALGRLSDGTREVDLDDNRLRRLRVLVFRWKIARKHKRGAARGRTITTSVKAKATLFAAYCHYKPRPYSGNVDIIASGKMRSGYEPDKSLWGILLPRRQIHLTARRHVELFKAQGGKTAAVLQNCIDRAIDRLQAARAEQA